MALLIAKELDAQGRREVSKGRAASANRDKYHVLVGDEHQQALEMLEQYPAEMLEVREEQRVDPETGQPVVSRAVVPTGGADAQEARVARLREKAAAQVWTRFYRFLESGYPVGAQLAILRKHAASPSQATADWLAWTQSVHAEAKNVLALLRSSRDPQSVLRGYDFSDLRRSDPGLDLADL